MKDSILDLNILPNNITMIDEHYPIPATKTKTIQNSLQSKYYLDIREYCCLPETCIEETVKTNFRIVINSFVHQGTLRRGRVGCLSRMLETMASRLLSSAVHLDTHFTKLN